VISLGFAAEFSSGLATYLLASSAAVGAGRRLQSAVALIGWLLREETTESERGPAERTGWMRAGCSSWMGAADGESYWEC
jgi:hypothetical protein